MTAVDPALIEWAVDLARAGGSQAAAAFRDSAAVTERKPDGSFVTATDRAVESSLRDRIASEFPEDGILGEEYGSVAGASGRRWILDPIDGTEAFVHGVAEFSTLVALADEDGIVVGVIDVPVLGETLWAGRGRGAFLNGERLAMSPTTSLEGVYLATSDLDDWPDGIVAAARSANLRVRTWGGGYGIGLAVSGRIDAFVDYDLEIWDIAPAVVLAAEAGGRCTALDGTSRLEGGSYLIAGSNLYGPLLELFGNDQSADLRDRDA